MELQQKSLVPFICRHLAYLPVHIRIKTSSNGNWRHQWQHVTSYNVSDDNSNFVCTGKIYYIQSCCISISRQYAFCYELSMTLGNWTIFDKSTCKFSPLNGCACVPSSIVVVKMPFHIIHTDVVSLQYEWACDSSVVTAVKMPFHIVHTDVASLQCEWACEFSDVTIVKMPYHIVHTDVVSLQYEWACESSDLTAWKMPFHIIHTDVVSL